MFHKPENSIETIEHWIFVVSTYIMALFVIAMFVLMFIQVLFRYVLQMPLYWVEETARFLMIYITTIGGALAFQNHKHPRIMILYNKFSPKKRMVYEIFIRLPLLYFFWVFISTGWKYAKVNTFMMTSGLCISYFWPYLSIPIGGLVMFVLILLDTIDIVLYKRSYLVSFDE